MRQRQLIRGNTAFCDALTLNPGVLCINTDNYSIRVHDGVTPGGKVVPTNAMIAGFNFRRFTATASFGAPGNLSAAQVEGKLCEFTLAGNYGMPVLNTLTQDGSSIFLFATVAGVVIQRQSTNQFLDQNTLVNSINMASGETIEIARRNINTYHVLNRY